MRLHRQVKRLASGIVRAYHYRINDDGSRDSLGTTDLDEGSLQSHYRRKTQQRILAALQSAESLLVVGEVGCGKTFLGESVAEELITLGFPVAYCTPRTIKQSLLRIARDFGTDTENLEGKPMNTTELKEAIAEWLQDHTGFLIIDDAHKQKPEFRDWLEDLHKQGQPLLLLATYPPARDIFLRLPRIELKPLPPKAIREIMIDHAQTLGIELDDGQIAALQQRCGGNPMLARRVVREEYLGLEDLAPDHTEWIDGTPFLVAGLMCFVIVRFLGLGFNSTSLYLLGGILTVSVGVVRILISAMPRSKGRLGQ